MYHCANHGYNAEPISWNTKADWVPLTILAREDYLDNRDDPNVDHLPTIYWSGANTYFGDNWEFYDAGSPYNRGRVPMDIGWAEGHPEPKQGEGQCAYIDGATGKLFSSTSCLGLFVCQKFK